MLGKNTLVPVAVLGLFGAPSVSADTPSFKVQFVGCTEFVGWGPVSLAAAQLAGNSAEWIVEEPFPIPGGDTLPDYGEVFFANCEAYFAGGGGVGGGTGTAVNIVAGKSNSVVSQGVLISSSIIQCSYTGPEA
jgi:hypothetical protein